MRAAQPRAARAPRFRALAASWAWTWGVLFRAWVRVEGLGLRVEGFGFMV